LKKNYLNNRDILKEIHISKASYCSYLDYENDNQQDLIVSSLAGINKSAVGKARAARIARIERETKEKVNPKTIKKTDLVFRVMTWEHIPLAPPKLTKAQAKSKKSSEMLAALDLESFMSSTEEDEAVEESELDEIIIPEVTTVDPSHIKVNFPPFFHYRFNDDDELVQIAKSHWVGDFETGSFSKTHGTVTDTLARMIIKLVERYATRPNWRGYTYVDEMRAQAIMQLSQVCLQFNEQKSENGFSYFSMIAQNSFTRILNIEKRNQSVRDDLLEKHGLTPSFARQNKNAHLD